jgi:hypothetical protein
MAKKVVEKRVFLPKWVAWFVTIIMLPVLWGLATSDPEKTDGLIVGGLTTIGVIVMMFLMAYKKLPAYIIEETEK